eukprot:jgi/Mesen1/2346/ME000156S01494
MQTVLVLSEGRDRDFTLVDIIATAKLQKVELQLEKKGPLFTIKAINLQDKSVLGKAQGFLRPWVDGLVLHLDSIQMASISSSKVRSLFGVALLIGALAVRHGYDSGCRRVELLAINDSDEYHRKLVRYYARMGFKAVHEVEGGSVGDMVHMLVWGGVGTRMDGDVEELLRKWSSRLIRRPREGFRHEAT